MKKLILSLCVFIPFFGFSGTGTPVGKPVKQVSAQSPAVNFATFNHVAGISAKGPFVPLPFLSGSNTAALKGIQLTRDPYSGMPIMIDDIPFDGIVTEENISTTNKSVLSSVAALLGVKHSDEEFEMIAQQHDNLGMIHIKLQQVYKGLPVYGAQGWLHFSPNGKVCFNGRTQVSPALASVLPHLSVNEAQTIVRNDVGRFSGFYELNYTDAILGRLKQYESELVILPNPMRFGRFNLTWHITVRPNILNRWEYFVDAETGEIRNKYDYTCSLGATTAQATDLAGVTRTIGTFNANSQYYLLDAGKQMYTGTQTSLPNAGQGVIITLDAQNTNPQNFNYTDITTSNNTWNNPRAVSAHYNAETAWDYYENTFGRNSINGNGGDVVSFINVTDANGGGLDNAFWNGQYMFYGNGNTQFTPLAKALDVGGHEMTHGVVQETANLEYQGEAGAMNESFADVFGTLIERNNWKLGEDVVVLSQYPSGCLRDMQDPHNGGASIADRGWQPSHTNEQYTGTADNGGVHINSGIPNHAYYLIASALGKGTAEAIYYRALTMYLTKSSQFIDLRLAVVKAAEDIHGVGSSQANTVKQSFDAVGIGNGSGTNTTPTLPTNPGSNKLLIVNLDGNDANTLYLTDDNATAFTPISQTSVTHKPTVTDDGTYALFVGADHNIYSIELNTPFTQTQLTTDAYWDNVAISKDGSRLAAASQFQDTAIWVYDFTLQQWGKFHLYNPTTAPGVDAGGVLYADALEWSYDGTYVLYDAYNKLNGSGGMVLDYWDIGFLRAWNRTANNFNDGEIFKAYNSLDEGISVGNPTFTKNSPYIIAFDYINNTTSEYDIMGANLETNETGLIFQNSDLGYPSYNPQDNKVAFNAVNTQSQPVIAFINVDQTKITGNAASAVAMVLLAGYANWFGTGVRQLPSAIREAQAKESINVYPNPASDLVKVDLDEAIKDGGSLRLINVFGQTVAEKHLAPSEEKTATFLSLKDLPSGLYFVSVESKGERRGVTKVMKE